MPRRARTIPLAAVSLLALGASTVGAPPRNVAVMHMLLKKTIFGIRVLIVEVAADERTVSEIKTLAKESDRIVERLGRESVRDSYRRGLGLGPVPKK